jgi:hypothetical protein
MAESEGADREVVVMAQITRLFADLSRAEQSRILRWAEGRYITAPLEEADVTFFSRFTQAALDAAKELGGDMNGQKIIEALIALRQAQVLALPEDEA